MTRIVATAVTSAVLLATTTACGGASRVASAADDVARVAAASDEDVLALARLEARTTGSTADDVLARWRSGVVRGGTTGLDRYRQLPPEARSIACGAAADVLSDAFDGDARTDPQPLLSAVEALSGMNQNVAMQGLVGELQGAVDDLGAGRSARLELLVLKAATCEAAGQ